MADNDTVSWYSSVMGFSNGATRTIKSGTSATDVSGGLQPNIPYVIFWESSKPTIWQVVIASRYDGIRKHMVAMVTGAASGGTAPVSYTHLTLPTKA